MNDGINSLCRGRDRIPVQCFLLYARAIPTTGELAAWRERRGQLDEAYHRITALIATEQTALDRALHAVWEGEDRLKEAARIELERRN